MQGAEIEDEGSVLEYMTKSEFEEQHSRFAHYDTTPPFLFCAHLRLIFPGAFKITPQIARTN